MRIYPVDFICLTYKLDNLYYHNVHKATEALGDAAQYHAKKAKLICGGYIILAVVAIFLIVYLYLSSESDNSNNQSNNMDSDQKGQNQNITTTPVTTSTGWDPCMVPPYCP